MPDPRLSRENYLDLDEDVATASVEQIDEQVAMKQERLLQLKRQTEQLEREKQKLEELARRQDQFESGRGEMVDKFTSSLVYIQRETDETLKRLEILKSVQEKFSSYLKEIEVINPKDWAPAELSKELSNALGVVEDARSVYVKAQAQVRAEEEISNGGASYEGETYNSGGQSFAYWLMAGFGFTLPLFALGLLALVLWFLHLASA